MKKTVYVAMDNWNDHHEYIAVEGSYQDAREAMVEYLRDPHRGFPYEEWEKLANIYGFYTAESFQEHVIMYSDWDTELGIEIIEEEVIF